MKAFFCLLSTHISVFRMFLFNPCLYCAYKVTFDFYIDLHFITLQLPVCISIG